MGVQPEGLYRYINRGLQVIVLGQQEAPLASPEESGEWASAWFGLVFELAERRVGLNYE